jgi:hypothetical protein
MCRLAHVVGHLDLPFVTIILEVSILVLIESAAVWRFCWALVGGKRE